MKDLSDSEREQWHQGSVNIQTQRDMRKSRERRMQQAITSSMCTERQRQYRPHVVNGTESVFYEKSNSRSPKIGAILAMLGSYITFGAKGVPSLQL